MQSLAVCWKSLNLPRIKDMNKMHIHNGGQIWRYTPLYSYLVIGAGMVIWYTPVCLLSAQKENMYHRSPGVIYRIIFPGILPIYLHMRTGERWGAARKCLRSSSKLLQMWWIETGVSFNSWFTDLSFLRVTLPKSHITKFWNGFRSGILWIPDDIFYWILMPGVYLMLSRLRFSIIEWCFSKKLPGFCTPSTSRMSKWLRRAW